MEETSTVREDSGQDSDLLWMGRPWIVPAIVLRSLAAIVVAVASTWLGLRFSVATLSFLGIQLILWSYVLISLAWLLSLTNPLLRRASNTYILRRRSLEVESGIVGKRSFMISATGFSELELVRSASDRLLNVGDVVITSDSGRKVTMRSVRNPSKVSSMVKEVMSRPVVGIQRDDQDEPQ